MGVVQDGLDISFGWWFQIFLPTRRWFQIFPIGGFRYFHFYLLVILGFKYLFIFTPIPGEMIQFDARIFCGWVVQPPTIEFYSNHPHRIKGDHGKEHITSS